MSEKNLLRATASDMLSGRLRADKRKEVRHSLTLPVRVAGSANGRAAWSEQAETVNVSSGGIAICLSRKVIIGDILFLEVALPERFQPRTEPLGTYKSYARVRYIEVQEHRQIVRLQFLSQPVRAKTLQVRVKF